MTNPIETKSTGDAFEKIFHFQKKYYQYTNDADFESQCAQTMSACTTELLIRLHLKRKNFQYASLLISSSVDKQLNGLFPTNEDINEDFLQKWNKLNEYVKLYSDQEISLTIERGKPVVTEIDFLSKNWKNSAGTIIDRITELYELLCEAAKVNLVHLDLKLQNLLRVIRNGNPDKWVLNDFDISMLLAPLKQKEPYHVNKTLSYSAPETLGADLNGYDEENGYKVDVFSASLIAYQLLNDGVLPDGLNTGKEKERIKDCGVIDSMQKNGEYGLPLPLHGEAWLKDIIMTGLTIDEKNRPSAAEMLEHLESQKSFCWYEESGTQHVPQQLGSMLAQNTGSGQQINAQNSTITIYQNKPSQEEKVPPPPPVGKWKKVLTALFIAAIFILLGLFIFRNYIKQDTTEASVSLPMTEIQTTVSALSTTVSTTTSESTAPVTTTSETATVTDKTINTERKETDRTVSSNIIIIGAGQNSSEEAAAPVTTLSEEPIQSETTCEFSYQPVTYTIPDYQSDGTIEISGIEITGYNGYFPGGELQIPAELDGIPVVGIGNGAFQQLENPITALDIPNVVYIDDYAFSLSYCNSDLNLDHVRYIGAYAFYNCTDISAVTFSDKLSYLGEKAFWTDELILREYTYNRDITTWFVQVKIGNMALGQEGTYNFPDP